MRLIGLFGIVLAATPVVAQEPPPAPPQPQPRYGVAAETNVFPQDSPKRLLASIQKCFERQRVDYLIAHLTDPAFTDTKINLYYRQRFNRDIQDDLALPEAERDARQKTALGLFVAEVNDHLDAEPKQTLRFKRLLKDGVVEEAGTSARVTLKETPGVVIMLKQQDGFWYLVNKIEGETPPGPAPTDKPKP